MNLNTAKNAVLSLLDMFNLSKGKKIVKEPAAPIPPLIQRLNLPEMPRNNMNTGDKRAYVFMVITQRFPKQISKRVLGKIVRHYGVDLRGYRMFRTMPAPRANMLQVLA